MSSAISSSSNPDRSAPPRVLHFAYELSTSNSAAASATSKLYEPYVEIKTPGLTATRKLSKGTTSIKYEPVLQTVLQIFERTYPPPSGTMTLAHPKETVNLFIDSYESAQWTEENIFGLIEDAQSFHSSSLYSLCDQRLAELLALATEDNISSSGTQTTVDFVKQVRDFLQIWASPTNWATTRKTNDSLTALELRALQPTASEAIPAAQPKSSKTDSQTQSPFPELQSAAVQEPKKPASPLQFSLQTVRKRPAVSPPDYTVRRG